MLTKREFLVAGSAGLVGSCLPFASPAQAGLLRRDIVDFEKDAGALQALRDALHLLRSKDDYGKRPALDGWHALATNHNLWCFGEATYEIHFGWWFLPWHRAYLIHIEKALQAAISEPKLRLPYWNWVRTTKLPKSFADATYLKGGTQVVNPLYDSTRLGPVGQGGEIDFIDLGAPQKTERELVAPSTFSGFGGAKPSDESTGSLESTPHNYIHRAIGYDEPNDKVGNMGTGMSPLDPVFLLHHGNLDRLWTVWLNRGEGRDNPKDADWLVHNFAFPTFPDIEFTGYKVSELLNTEKSAGNYRYDRERLVEDVIAAGPGGLTLNRFSLPIRDGAVRDISSGIQIELPANLQSSLSALQPAQSGATSVVLQGVPVPDRPVTVRVFGQPEGSDQKTLIGSFSLLPTSRASKRTNIVLPISDSARQLFSRNQNVSITGETQGSRPLPLSIQNFSIEVSR